MKLDFSKLKVARFKSSGSGRKITYPQEDEDAIVQWVLEQRDLHLPVSVQSIMNKASELISKKNPSFLASRGWAQKFMRRNNLVIRMKTTMSQKLPAALEEKISPFQKAVARSLQENEFPFELIGNMDETPMYFDVASNNTVENKGTKTISVRTTEAEKRHLTVVLAATADGKMLPGMVIFKGKRKTKGIEVPAGWIVCMQEKGWLDGILMKINGFLA